MRQIIYATIELLPNDVYKIGYIVIPHNMTDYEMILDDVMHGAFPFYHDFAEPRDSYDLDIMRLDKAAQHGYNLTTPDTLGVPWSPNGRVIWEQFGEKGDIFADDENWILLVNFERGFLELACVCVRDACGDVPAVKTALLELGEESLWGPDFTDESSRILEGDGRVQRLSTAISGFVDQTSLSDQQALLRAIVLTGGASLVAVDTLRSALFDSLPFIEEEWRFKTTVDPAFVPSLGAALRVRNELLAERRRRDNP